MCTAPDPGRDARVRARGASSRRACSRTSRTSWRPGARMKLASEQTRADAAALAADQSVPLKHVLDRAESIAKEAIPRALKPILPALRAAQVLGKLDPSGVGAMMVDVDAAEARVSAVLEASRPPPPSRVGGPNTRASGPRAAPGARDG